MTKKRVLLGCGIVLGFGILLSAACAGLVYYQAQRMFITDPAKAEEMAQSIMGYEISGGGKGVFAMDMYVVRMALVADDAERPRVMLMLMEIAQMEGQDPDKLQRDMSSRMFDRLEIESRTTVDGTLDKVPVEITVTRGTARKKKISEPFVSLQTVVEHDRKHYIPVVFGMGPDGESQANAVFSSLRFR